MATLDDVILAHQKAISAAVQAAGMTIVGDVLDGLPSSDDLIRDAANQGGAIISVYGTTVSSMQTRYAPVIIDPDFTIPAQTGTAGTAVVAKVGERIQVTIWTRTAQLRSQLYDAIMARVGTPWSRVLDCANGESCATMYSSGPRKVDETVGDLMIKRADLFFDTEYDLSYSLRSDQVAQGEADITVTDLTSIRLTP